MRLTTAAALALLATPALAEEQVACTILGCEKVEMEISPFTGSDSFSVQEVWSVVNDILGVSGLAPNFLVVETQEVGNAAAVIIEEQRYLAFNPVWMQTYRDRPDSKWQLYAVMAHEVGHHLQGHTITAGGSRPPTELEADEYAGFTLAALGATLDQSLALWRTFGEAGSATHPPRQQRLDAVTRGWERRNGPASSTPVVQSTPVPPPATGQTARAPQVAGESCRRYALEIATTQVCASSTLDEQKGNSYDLRNLFDGDMATAWVEGVSGGGAGQQLSFSFEKPVSLRSVSVANGYQKSQASFGDNARVRSFRVLASNGVEGVLELTDATGLASFNVSGLDGIEWVTFTIDAVYPGARWQDTAISEMGLE